METAGMKKLVTVERCTPMYKDSNKSLGVIVGYKLKLKYSDTITVVSEFGESSRDTQETYYMDVKQPCEEGLSKVLDFSPFRIVEKPYTIKEGPNAGEIANLKHLVIK